MFFRVLERFADIPTVDYACAFLIRDNWDDYASYKTLFKLVVVDEQGNRYDIGEVKIGQKGLRPSATVSDGHRSPTLSEDFDSLENTFFSLGESESYYETLNKTLDDELKENILRRLRDSAFDLNLFDQFRDEDVMKVSLMRYSSEAIVRTRYHRLATGNEILTPCHFKYTFSAVSYDDKPIELEFNVKPDSYPPTNVHVIIGRNGVGKTYLMGDIIETLTQAEELQRSKIQFISDDDESGFSNIVKVSFSPFDKGSISINKENISLETVGLFFENDNEKSGIKNLSDLLAKGFSDSFDKCRIGIRCKRWLKAMQTLNTDPIFDDLKVENCLEFNEDEVALFFKKLSSGHSIVLLTITRLVELVNEKTLVVIDEPETHLHPPLLAAFIRMLSELLSQKNGVAIVATHSPVVLQEVPRSCVWKLDRRGDVFKATRPEFETFGENVSILTTEVFGLEVTRSGYFRLLKEVISNEGNDYLRVINKFDNQLGSEAKTIVRSLIAQGEI